VRRDGYLFTCEFDGEITPTKEDMEKDPGAVPVEFRMMEEIPFATVTVAVPLNAADPLSAARGIAEREIGLKEVARSRVSLFDPTRKVWKPEKSGKHTVTLETPWRVAG
jgi:hypothetical protein